MTEIVIPWPPRSKGRPRMTKSGHTYTPPETRKAEEAIRAAFKEAMPNWTPLEGPIEVAIFMHDSKLRISLRTTGDYESRKLRGDIDNYGKLVLDALNGVAWVDDRQIGMLLLEKR